MLAADQLEELQDVEPISRGCLSTTNSLFSGSLGEELCDDVDRILTRVQHANVQDLDHLVHEDGEESLVANGKILVCLHALLSEAGDVVEGVGEEGEERWQKLGRLDEEAGQLTVPLKGLKDELNNRIDRHIDLVKGVDLLSELLCFQTL